MTTYVDVPADYEVAVRGELVTGDGVVLLRPPEGMGNAEQRVEDVAWPLRHGLIAGRALLGGRQLILDFAVVGERICPLPEVVENIDGNEDGGPIDGLDDGELLDGFDVGDVVTTPQRSAIDRLADLAGAWRPLDVEDEGRTTALQVGLADETYLLFGRPGRMETNLDTLQARGSILVTAEFVATDPRIYRGADPQTTIVGLGTVLGGLELPHGFPHGFGSATGSSAIVTNGGNFDTDPVITFTAGAGGLLNPVVEHVDAGESFEVLISLAEGETLVVDFAQRTVLLNGTTSRSNLVRRPDSTWFTLTPGDNEVRFAAGGGDGTMTVSWRDAYTFG